MNEKIVILSLSVLNNYSIADFKLNAFKTIFNDVFFEIEMELNRLLTFSSIIIYLF